jgi:hypothetical protein
MWSLAACTSPAAAKLVAGDDGAWPEEASRASPDLAQGSQGGDRAGEGRAGRRRRAGPGPTAGAAGVRCRRGLAAMRRCGGVEGGAGKRESRSAGAVVGQGSGGAHVPGGRRS